MCVNRNRFSCSHRSYDNEFFSNVISIKCDSEKKLGSNVTNELSWASSDTIINAIDRIKCAKKNWHLTDTVSSAGLAVVIAKFFDDDRIICILIHVSIVHTGFNSNNKCHYHYYDFHNLLPMRANNKSRRILCAREWFIAFRIITGAGWKILVYLNFAPVRDLLQHTVFTKWTGRN